MWKLQKWLWSECVAEQVRHMSWCLRNTHCSAKWVHVIYNSNSVHSHVYPYVFSSVVADAVVFISLLLLIKTFPTWLYPCLFYIQVTIALVTAGVVSRVKDIWGSINSKLPRKCSFTSFWILALSVYTFCRCFHISQSTSHRHLEVSILMWVQAANLICILSMGCYCATVLHDRM